MKRFLFCISALVIVFLSLTSVFAAPKEKDVLMAMKKASGFMMNTVSTNGGFVWNYSSDLSEQWGEVPARKTQIWVQGASNGVGEMFLKAYHVTGDTEFLEYARRVADAIIWGQYPAGGWHYLIDFDMPGIQKWYDEVASKCWGWEEYYHYYGNCTFDDDATASSIRFLLKLYMTTLDPDYRTPLIKALEFVLEAQFSNGAWPQRYPLKFDFAHHGLSDYTSYYTFNDGVIPNNINLLLDAYDKLGDKRYYDAARRAMDFYLISQGPPEQAGWAQQYTWDMQPAQARSYEPAAYQPSRTKYSIDDLMRFYKITKDRRYLRPIPLAVKWLENSAIENLPAPNRTHARFYEPGTNKPLYVHRTGTSIDNGNYYADQNPDNLMCHLSMFTSFDTEAMWKEFNRVNALSPDEAHAEYMDRKNVPVKVPKVDPEKVEKLIATLDRRGAWLSSITISNYANPCSEKPKRRIEGISTRTFQSNMQTLINYLSNKMK